MMLWVTRIATVLGCLAFLCVVAIIGAVSLTQGPFDPTLPPM